MQQDTVKALAETTAAPIVEAKQVEVRQVESRLAHSRRFGKQGREKYPVKSHFPARAIFALGVALAFWAAVLAMFMLGERLTSFGWLGVLLSFAGVALIASGEGQGIHLAPQALIILAAALAWGMYIVIQKYFLGRYSALEFTAYSVWLGTLLLVPFGRGLVHTVHDAPASGTRAVIYLGIFPAAIASFAWSYALSHGPAGRISSFLYVIPVLATFIAWMWLGEVPRPLSLVSGAIAICGVVAMNVWGRVPATVTEPLVAVEADGCAQVRWQWRGTSVRLG